jgi:hypothetical protein
MKTVLKFWACVLGVFFLVGVIAALVSSGAGRTTDPLDARQGAVAGESTPAKVRKVTPPADLNAVGSGTYEVGSDIRPGKYKTAGPDGSGGGCYWSRLKDLDGGVDSIVANDILQGPGVVVVKRSDAAFETNGCKTWHRVAS